jgi:putative redox protein
MALRVTFPGSSGDELAARLDLPPGPVRAYALFAHCFTCSKDTFAVHRIASELAMRGIGVLRFDFTGLGESGGEFAGTNFSSNIEDLRRAAAYLAEHHGPAELLIGHSLGGAAVLAAAGDMSEVRAVVTIGAPADAEHVLQNFHADLDAIERTGEAAVQLAGRRFTVRRQFLDDVREQNLQPRIHDLHRPLLILHAPGDEVVGIENATRIYKAALTRRASCRSIGGRPPRNPPRGRCFAAEIIAAWSGRYLAPPPAITADAHPEWVRSPRVRRGRFQQVLEAAGHQLISDEPESLGEQRERPVLTTCSRRSRGMHVQRASHGLFP